MKTIAIRVVLLAVCIIGSVCFAPVIVNADGFVLWADIITEIDDLVPATKITLNSITESDGAVALEGTSIKKMYVYDLVLSLEDSTFFTDNVGFNFGNCPDNSSCEFSITAPLEQKPFSLSEDLNVAAVPTSISDTNVTYSIIQAAAAASISSVQYSPSSTSTMLIDGTTYQVKTYSVATTDQKLVKLCNFFRQLETMPYNNYEVRGVSLEDSEGNGLWDMGCELAFVFLPLPTPTPTQQSATTPTPTSATTATAVPTATKSTQIPTPTPTTVRTSTPTSTPTPIPQSTILVSAIIGQNGGTVETSDGQVRVTFPAGTLSDDTAVTISSGSCHSSDGQYSVGNTCFSIIPSGAMSGDATICIEYSDYDLSLANGDTSLLTLGYYSGGQWHEATDVYVSGNEICCTTDHLSDWAVLIEQISKASSVPIAVYIGGGIGAIAVLAILAALRRRVTVSNKTNSRIGRMRTQMEKWRGEGYDVSDLEDLFK